VIGLLYIVRNEHWVSSQRMRKKGSDWWRRTSKQNMLRKRYPGTWCRPEVELGAHTRRDVGVSSMSGSESSDQPTKPAELSPSQYGQNVT
jgi:hypothetical protein